MRISIFGYSYIIGKLNPTGGDIVNIKVYTRDLYFFFCANFAHSPCKAEVGMFTFFADRVQSSFIACALSPIENK